MRRVILSFLLVWTGSLPGVAELLPLTANDLSLMLRSGYTSPSVINELAKRHFVGGLDATQEQKLVKAGASPELIAAIENGTYSLSPAESAKAEQKISDLKELHEIAVEKAKTSQAQYERQTRENHSVAAKEQPATTATVDFLNGALVRYREGNFVPAEDDALAAKKYILYYFSAHWCGPCRQFTPKLIDYYNRVVATHPEVEVVFYSCDRSTGEMANYMRETGMPWLAIDYAKRKDKKALSDTAGQSIPALFLVENTGKLLSNTVVDGKYRGPDKVLADLDAILAGGSPKVAQAQSAR